MTTSYNRNWVASRANGIFFCDGSGSVPAPTRFVTNVVDSVTYGANYRDWKRRLADGIQCTTTLSGTKYTRQYGAGYFNARQTPTQPWITCQAFHYVSGNLGYVWGVPLTMDFPLPLVPSEQKADAKALQMFVDQIRQVQTTFQGGVFLGELRETIHLITSPAKSLRNGIAGYLATLKKRKRSLKRVPAKKRLATANRILSDTWLEYSFGWKPLLHDIDDAAKTLANRLASSPKWKPVFAKGIDEYTASNRVESLSGSIVEAINHRVDYVTRQEVQYRGQVSIEHPYSKVSFHSGLGLNDFVPTVWELIPYSFLVDYFANIGAIISASSLLQSNLRWSARTARSFFSCEVKDTIIKVTNNVNFATFGTCSPVTEKRTKAVVSRAPYAGSLVPPLNFYVPGVGSTRWANIGALLLGNRALVPFHR